MEFFAKTNPVRHGSHAGLKSKVCRGVTGALSLRLVWVNRETLSQKKKKKKKFQGWECGSSDRVPAKQAQNP
jgi:hypothetical protein